MACGYVHAAESGPKTAASFARSHLVRCRVFFMAVRGALGARFITSALCIQRVWHTRAGAHMQVMCYGALTPMVSRGATATSAVLERVRTVASDSPNMTSAQVLLRWSYHPNAVHPLRRRSRGTT